MDPSLGFLLPLVFAALAFLAPSDRWRPWFLPAGATANLGLALRAIAHSRTSGGGWLRVDPLAMVMILTVALLFFFCSLYAPGYLRVRRDQRNRVFCGGLLVLLATLNLVAMAQHLGLMWVAIEATTLASAFVMLYFNQTPRSLEAAWKYLLICSVGIALALLGSFFLAYASLAGGRTPTLLFDDLTRSAGALSVPWLHAAFVTLLVGYGTKMGLAPMHTWKPDTYGEAPGIVGALLAGGVTSGAFIAILRLIAIVKAAGEDGFAGPILVGMGLLSMAWAAVFMARQKDFKRMLAYSSVEHMGILVLGAGIGGLALFGALLHVVNNAMTKGVLFLSAGNIHRAFGSKTTDDVTGAARRVPVSAGLFLTGFLAITGAPPFGPFVSELTIVRGAFASQHHVAAGLFLLLLMAVFLGMGSTVLTVVQGEPKEHTAANAHGAADAPSLVLPIAGLLAVVLCLGLWVPPPLLALLHDAAASVEGRP